MKKNTETAVSPVVAVMLMLVITIIIAAIVSAFAGGAVSGVKKVPQATITGKFSLSDGLEIIHSGGDGIATSDMRIIVRDGSMFNGQNLEQKTSQVLNRSIIANGKGQYLEDGTGNPGFSSFGSGDSMFITGANSTCEYLQPGIYGSNSLDLCIGNSTNIGKVFSLEVSDARGNLISKSDVTISP